ncbi:MAG: hypothetical protein NC402_05220 [Prevotella sp.]|nr:hypothetical protein [Prevotella sp.]MCM1075484.1 hypothetical protein [Ruminococcus sp.]
MNTKTNYTPQPEMANTMEAKRSFSLGVLNNYPDSEETRQFLTPEACGMLVGAGIDIWLEAGAGININYSDEAYAENGCVLKTRAEVLACDVVLCVRPLRTDDVLRLKKGATMLTLFDPQLPKQTVEALAQRDATMIALDKMVSENGVRIFSRILDEIDGRAAILYAQEGLSFLGEGKGVLMGGIPGLQPCEVLLIGAGARILAAAKAALQTGARVTLMDNDIAALDDAIAACGDRLITSSIHPKVLYNDVKHSDVIIIDSCTREFTLPDSLTFAMKENVYFLDLNETVPSLIVPRSVAMAISNLLINFFNDTLRLGGMKRIISTVPGVRAGMVTYRGHLVNKQIASSLGVHALDLGIMLTQSN